MKLKLLLLISCWFLSINLFAQPANDDCAGAINIGTLPAPGPCIAGIENGAATTVSGNLAGATPGNPYLFSTGCQGGTPVTSSPANDVWYFFTASGHIGHFNITGTIVNPNIAVYAGNNCTDMGNIGGVGGCIVGTAGGTASLTVNQMTIGNTYFIQISSNDAASFGTFTLSVDNDNDCNNCLTSSNLTVNPNPIGGAYQPGDVVNFCYTIDGWSQQNTNWLHGVQITYGSGWAGISGQVGPAAICNGGTWGWYNSVTSGTPPNGTGLTFGQGFYFDTGDAGTNPGNNFGDAAVDAFGNPTCDPSPAQPLTFCFTLTVAAACNPGADLSVTINTTGDGESGGWQDAGCANDPAYIFNAHGSCCPPNMTSTPETCVTNDGTATATPVGAAGPYDYSWTGPGGYTSNSTGVAGANTITGLNSGTYTVTITDATLCAISNTVTVTDNSVIPGPPTTAPVSYCLNATAGALTATPSAGGTLNWYGTNAVGGVASATAPTPSTATAGSTTYYVSQTVGGCEGPRAPLVVTINPLPTPNAGSNSPVCVGAAINLTSSGGTSYAWTGPNAFVSATQNPTIASATAAMAGTYSVMVTDANGCQAQATTIVVVNPLPVPVVGSNSPVCVGATINLTSSGGTSYAWTGPNAFASATQNPNIAGATVAMAGTYSVMVTNANGCQAQGTTIVIVNPLPTPIVGSNSPICVGDNLNLTASGGTSYVWTGPNSFASLIQNPTISSVTILASGAYNVLVTDANNCSATGTTNVTVNPLPVPIVGSNSPVCAGTAINLTASGGTGYAWTGPNAFASATQNPSIASATAAMAGTYSVMVTDINGCQAQGTTIVNVNPLPTPIVGSNSPQCVGSTINLTASGGTGFAWTGPNAFASAAQNPSITNVSIAADGTYDVIVTDANGCQAQGSTTVVINPVPTPTAANTGPYCVNGTINLTSLPAGMASYAWTGPLGFTSAAQDTHIVIITIPMAGTYSVTVTDLNGCIGQATTAVTVNPLPTVTASNNGPLCDGTTLNLNATGGVSYSWSGPGGYTSPVQNPTITNATLSNAGNYAVTVTDANNCVNANVTTVTINSNPIPDASTNGPVCVNSDLQLTLSQAYASYSWSGPNGFISGIQNPVITSVSSAAAGQYSVTVTDANGCQGTDTVTTGINPLPVATLNPIASGCAPICRDFFLSSNSNLVSYSWNMGNTSFSGNDTILNHCYNDPGVYSISVDLLDNNGCAQTMNFSNWVTVYANPIADFSFGPESVTILEPEIDFQDQSLGSNIIGYSWQFGDPNNSTSGLPNPSFTYPDVGYYNVTLAIMNANTCVDTITKTIYIPEDWAIYVPNAFSPNDDGINDYFYPKGVGINESTFQMWIFDRWGNMIYYTTDWNNGAWDGKVQGHSNLVQEDVYIWKITAKSFKGNKYNGVGHVTVVR